MISLQDCQTVLALLEDRHFARAARRLGVTQPALTARLQRIEGLVGARLFDRNRGGVRPTPAGLGFADGARATLDAADRTVTAAQNAADGLGETLLIGMTQVTGYRVMEEILRNFREQQPKARVLLRESTTARLEAQLESGEVDVALLHPPIHGAGLSERLLLRGELVELNLSGSPTSNVIHYPRAEAPVLMGQLGRSNDKAGRRSAAEADTMLGVLLLSKSGYGSCTVDSDYASKVLGKKAIAKAKPISQLDIGVAWRQLDRRKVVLQFIEVAKRTCADLPVPLLHSFPDKIS